MVKYVEAIDHLLGFVGRRVLVRVSSREDHPGFVMLNGTLAQGEGLSEVWDGEVAFFGLSDSGDSDGLYIPRREYVDARYDNEDERLTIWLGPIAVTVSQTWSRTQGRSDRLAHLESAEQIRLLGRKLLVRQDPLLVKFGEASNLVGDISSRCWRGGCRGWVWPAPRCDQLLSRPRDRRDLCL